MNIDANAWIQPEKSVIRPLKAETKEREKEQPKSWWARPSSPGFSAWCHPSLSGACATVRGGRQEPKATGSPSRSRPKQRDTENCYLAASSQVFTADTGGGGLKFTFLQRCPPQQKLLEHSSPPSPEKQPAPPRTPSLRQPHFCA